MKEKAVTTKEQMVAFSGRALDRVMGSATNDWTPRRHVETDAISRLPRWYRGSNVEDYGTEDLSEHEEVALSVDSWMDAAEAPVPPRSLEPERDLYPSNPDPKMLGKPNRMRVNHHVDTRGKRSNRSW